MASRRPETIAKREKEQEKTKPKEKKGVEGLGPGQSAVVQRLHGRHGEEGDDRLP